MTEELYDCVYTGFVEEIDAVDNGINDRDGVPRFVYELTLSVHAISVQVSTIINSKHIKLLEC